MKCKHDGLTDKSWAEEHGSQVTLKKQTMLENTPTTDL